MLLRAVTSIIALPILIGIVTIGGTPLKIAVAFLSVIGMLEFYKAISKNYKLIHFLGIAFAVVYILFNNANDTLFVLLILLVIVAFHKKYNIIDGAITLFGYYYICRLLYFINLVKEQSYGEYYVWLIFISAWGCDTGAYLVGTVMGKHKIAPVLSPNKTLEGSIGGVLFALILSFVFGLVVFELFDFDHRIYFLVIGGVVSIFGQAGDLVASAIKRYIGIKDYGYIFPGHGGVIDRFDSVLFTAPVVYYLVDLI